jgi:catechol 2,3-dioxygenase-like lactoylglutathione lyase family enzyme
MPTEGADVKIEGITFVGTRTAARPEMAAFVRDVLGLLPSAVSGLEADLFDLPDGSSFAVAPAAEGPRGERTIGFVVADIDAAAAELREAGVETDEDVATNDRYRYVHFRAPDGHLYELVQLTAEAP